MIKAEELRAIRKKLADLKRKLEQREAELSRAQGRLECRFRERAPALTAANTELQREINERKRLEKELAEVTEKERRRLGQNLHDDLGQSLTGIALMTQSLEQRLKELALPESADAAKIRALANQAIGHARTLARDLTSAELDERNLPLSLGALARHVQGLFDTSCDFQCEGTIPQLAESITRQLFYIAQEATTNAIKHGRARHVWIRLAGAPDQLRLTVRNDGAPFAAAPAVNTGMGLRIMNYRARVVGASLEVGPGAERGTAVSCLLPLRSAPVAGASSD